MGGHPRGEAPAAPVCGLVSLLPVEQEQQHTSWEVCVLSGSASLIPQERERLVMSSGVYVGGSAPTLG